MLLTDVKVRSAKARSRPYKLNDGEGLVLVTRPSGSKFWQFRYRFAGREKSLSLGKYPKVTLAEARASKSEAQSLLRDGIDPSNHRRQQKLLAQYRDRNSFLAVAQDWHERNRDAWTEKYAKNTWSRLEGHILPSLGRRPIAEITPVELLSILQGIEATGATYMSHRALQICTAIYDYAKTTGRAENNVARGLGVALKPHRVKHYPTLSGRELPDFLKALERLETSEQNKLAFRILLLTAVRTGELRYSRWADIDLDRSEWRLRPEITKMRTEHIVPLSRQTIGALEELSDISGKSEWLVPSQQARVHQVMSENTINDMIGRMGYKGRIVGHGFRSLFSTTLNEHGFNRDAIERQLAHMERDEVRAAYNRAEYLVERRHLMQWWADYLDGRTRE